jgi:hypothetical protein
METSDTAVVIGDPLAAFYMTALDLLEEKEIRFLVGGTFAFARYTGIDRQTKDLDIFVRAEDVPRTLATFTAAGYRTEVPFPHWLAKIWDGEHVLDVIFSSGNGVARVDEEWFAHAAESEVLGRRLQLCPIEEIIWSKAFVQERERFDGADVLHLLREAGRDIDWPRLVRRFGDNWLVLFGHLVAFSFVYPDRRDHLPEGLIASLAARLVELKPDPGNRICYGTLLSREQYLPDIEQWGYVDAREEPLGAMTHTEVEVWTEAIKNDKP